MLFVASATLPAWLSAQDDEVQTSEPADSRRNSQTAAATTLLAPPDPGPPPDPVWLTQTPEAAPALADRDLDHVTQPSEQQHYEPEHIEGSFNGTAAPGKGSDALDSLNKQHAMQRRRLLASPPPPPGYPTNGLSLIVSVFIQIVALA